MMTVQQFREWQAKRSLPQPASRVEQKSVSSSAFPVQPLRSEKKPMTEQEMLWYCNQAIGLGPFANDWCYRRSLSYLNGPGKNWSVLEAQSMAALDLIEHQKKKKKR